MTVDPAIRERAAAVLDRIARAAARSGRRPGEVRLVAVSKTHTAEAVAAAREAGLSVFGENYVQEAEGKIRVVPGAEWHLIGRLQRNKVAKAVALFPWIQTVDSAGLLAEISRRAAAAGRTVDLLAEVNLAGEAGKAGISPDGLPALLDAAAGLPGIRMRGLMAIPPFSDDAEASRPYFARLRDLLAQAARRAPRETEMTELSMGMSQDFEAAIEEGATMVRVGTAIFGPRRAR
ncbi:MAG: YggS family pyridoxal phosphate-dependent enzyme [Gemmatimonadota bacterium]